MYSYDYIIIIHIHIHVRVYVHVYVVPAPQVLQRSGSHSLTAKKQGQCLVLHEERHLQPGNLLVPVKKGQDTCNVILSNKIKP